MLRHSPEIGVANRQSREMKLTVEQVEEIVRSVLRELQPVPAPPVAPQSAGNAAVKQVVAVESDLISLSSLVVTESVLSAVGAAGRTVALPRGAVLTPSGRDYLRRHGVRLASRLPSAEGQAGKAGLVIQAQRLAVLESAAGTAGWSVEQVSGEDAAVGRVLQLHGVRPLVCVTADPAVAACLLNRRSDVRAAAVSDRVDLQRLMDRLQPTVVCLDGTGWSWSQLLRLLRMMSVVRTVPSGWREAEQGAGR